MSTKREESIKDSRRKNITIQGTGLITVETKVKDFVPQEILEDIRTLQAIYGRLDDYKQKKDADPAIWPAFSEDADSAMDHIMNAIYDMSSIAGRELDYHILNS